MRKESIPSITKVEKYLNNYGWQYKKVRAGHEKDMDVLLALLTLDDENGVPISFRVGGEFLMVSTVDFITEVAIEDINKFFQLNDTVKLVKVFPVSLDPLIIEVGFELWNEADNKDTFFAFLDMLCLAIGMLVEKQENKELKFTPKYIKAN